MVKTIQKGSITNESEDILGKIRRGNEGLSSQERSKLFRDVNRILGRIVEEGQFETFPGLISIWNEIYESAAVNKLRTGAEGFLCARKICFG